MSQILSEPWSYGFMRHAFGSSILLGALCGLVGCFIVLKGLAFAGDALGHSMLPGIVIAHLRQASPALGALGAATLAVVVISFISKAKKLSNDTIIGVVFPGFFALGIMLVSRRKSYAGDLTHVLFGNVLAVSKSDLMWQIALLLLVTTAIFLFYRQLLSVTFDPDFSEQMGLPVHAIHFSILMTIALTVVSGVQAVGTVLISALLVTPAATARLLTDRFRSMLWLAAALGSLSGLIGLYFSYYFGTAAGASIVVASVSLFLIALLFHKTERYLPTEGSLDQHALQ